MARRIDSYLKDLIPAEKMAFYEAVRDFGDSEIAPHLLHWERSHSLVPDSCIKAMGDMGLFGLPIAEAYGGQGGDHEQRKDRTHGRPRRPAACWTGHCPTLGIMPVVFDGTRFPSAEPARPPS